MLWTAPTLRHRCAKEWLHKANHIEGRHPWARLARLVLILRSQCFRCTGSMALAQLKVLEFFGGLSPCMVEIEACPSAHHWSRELKHLSAYDPKRTYVRHY
jgi:hypothetical protein